ncbi:MAG: mechanosensitive ion channel family protein [Verrucomicrobiota bacterium]
MNQDTCSIPELAAGQRIQACTTPRLSVYFPVMKMKFQSAFNAYVAVLVVILVWAVWADAQTVTNAVATTNAPTAMSKASVTLKNMFDPAQHQAMTFGLDRVEYLQVPVLGTPGWKYFAFGIYIALAWLASRIVDWLFQVVMKRLTEKTETKLDDMLVELLHGPVKVITFVILLHIGLNIFDWPVWVDKYLSRGLKLVVAWSITYMAVRGVDLLMHHLRTRAAEDDRVYEAQLFPVLSKTLKIFIVLVAFLVTAQNLDFNITGILASLSIGGLALGLAAQDTLANLFGAVAIFADKPFRVGDRIQLDTLDGSVERIGLRSSRVRNLDGHLVTIPNKTIANATVTNVSRRPHIRTVLDLGLTYDTSSAKIRVALAILEEIFRQHPKTEDLVISFNKFADSALNIQVIHWYKGTDWRAHLADMQAIYLTIKDRFDTAGIEFAFPTQTLHLKRSTGPGSIEKSV